MSRHFPVVLVGNALSAMVAATKLAQKGMDVAIVNGGKNWGGHFTTITCKDVSYDAGMVLYEFTSFNSGRGDEDPTTYDPAVRNDAGRFCNAVRRFIDGYQEVHDITVPRMYVGGKIHDDLLIANALTSMRELTFAERMQNELWALSGQPSRLHASHKHKSDDFRNLDYRTVSLANHGATFHSELIEPFCRKLFNISTDQVLALYHRVAWLPLFYPETLLSYLRGTPQPLPPTVFSYPIGECVGELASKLKTEIENCARITIVRERPIGVNTVGDGILELEFENQDSISTNRVAWANTLGELLRLLKLEEHIANYEKCSIALAFLRIPTRALKLDFTVLSIVDPGAAVYRITNQSRCSGSESAFAHVVVEFNPDYATTSEVAQAQWELNQRIAGELVSLGVVAAHAPIEWLEIKQMKHALMLPNDRNRMSFKGEMDAVLGVGAPISLLGPSSGYFSSSFNDQIVQGLKLCAMWEDSP